MGSIFSVRTVQQLSTQRNVVVVVVGLLVLPLLHQYSSIGGAAYGKLGIYYYA